MTPARIAPRRIVVVGAGLGGLRTVEHLRRLGYAGEIDLVGEERHLPYDRPPLTKGVLRGVEASPPYLRSPDSYDELAVSVHLGKRAQALDTDGSRVVLDDGGELAYDAAVIATGAVPRRLPGEQAVRGMHTLRTADDSRRIHDEIERHGSLVVIGGGFIGCEVAASARAMSAEVTVVELETLPLKRVLGDAVATEVALMHERAGVRLVLGVGVQQRREVDGVASLVLTDGTVLVAPLVVVGLGVVPALGWLDSSGLTIDNGIVCDAYGESSVPGVFAVGDVARWFDPLVERHVRIEHWTSAGEQAATVAANLLSAPEARTPLNRVPYFWSDQYGTKIQSLGHPSGNADVMTARTGKQGDRLLAVYGENGRFTGVVGFGLPRRVTAMRPLLQARASYAEAIDALAL
jgi:NADPH-dependent 2,4-dienoyl-CoA reductase/sulfur reductase-like enzyme